MTVPHHNHPHHHRPHNPAYRFQHKSAHVDWNLPKFREGFLGQVDNAIGPGATAAELGITLGALFFAIGFVTMVIFPKHPEWTMIQKGWVIFFSSNSGWGTLTATGAFKRWYHQEGSGISGKDLLICFSDVGTQFILANFLFLEDLGNKWWYALEYDLFLFTAFALFRFVPFYLRRPTNVAMLMVGALLATYIFEVIPGLEWFPYLIFMKNLLHIVREEPYRPQHQFFASELANSASSSSSSSTSTSTSSDDAFVEAKATAIVAATSAAIGTAAVSSRKGKKEEEEKREQTEKQKKNQPKKK